jgi:hypothetical protein
MAVKIHIMGVLNTMHILPPFCALNFEAVGTHYHTTLIHSPEDHNVNSVPWKLKFILFVHCKELKECTNLITNLALQHYFIWQTPLLMVHIYFNSISLMQAYIKTIISWRLKTQHYLQYAVPYVSAVMNSVLYAVDKTDTETEVLCHILIVCGDPDLIYRCRSCGILSTQKGPFEAQRYQKFWSQLDVMLVGATDSEHH